MDLKAAAILSYCRSRGIPEPVCEHRFAAPRRWAFDFAWPADRIALEVDGGLYGRGKPCPVCRRRPPAGHTSVERLLSDREKLTEAAVLGWRVALQTVQDVESGAVFSLIDRLFGGTT